MRLPNGKVLVAGGKGSLGALASAELYDPAAGTWTYTDALDQPQPSPLGVALDDGRILVVDSTPQLSNGYLVTHVAASQLYDPSTATWTHGVAVHSWLAVVGLIGLRDGTPLLGLGGCQLGGVVAGGCGLSHYATFDVQTSSWNGVIPIDPPGAAALPPDAGRVTSEGLLPYQEDEVDVVHQSALLPDGRALFMTGARPRLFRPDNSTARLVVSPERVDFGKTNPDSPVQRVVQLRNTGESTLTGSAAGNQTLRVVAGSPFVLPPGASTTVTLQFATSGVGWFPGAVQFKSNGNWLFVSTDARAGIRISGRITDSTGAGVGGVLVQQSGAAFDWAFTDHTGHYLLVAPPNADVFVTPDSGVRTFSPNRHVVTVPTQDITGVDFTTPFTPVQIGVARDGFVFLDRNRSTQWDGCEVDECRPLGAPGDTIVTLGSSGGRRKDVFAVFRDGTGVVDYNGNGRVDACDRDRCFEFGQPGDVPVVGDWLGQGGASFGVFRAGQWVLDLNSNFWWQGCEVDACLTFGQPGDVPVVGAWRVPGEATTSRQSKIGVFRDGLWRLDLNGNGRSDGCDVDACLAFGRPGDVPVVGDWTGTGHERIGVFRDGQWFVDRNGNGQWDGCDVDACFQFGTAGDAPLVGNW